MPTNSNKWTAVDAQMDSSVDGAWAVLDGLTDGTHGRPCRFTVMTTDHFLRWHGSAPQVRADREIVGRRVFFVDRPAQIALVARAFGPSLVEALVGADILTRADFLAPVLSPAENTWIDGLEPPAA